MSATELDPRTALVTIDLQKGMAPYPFTRPFREVVATSARLVDAFRRAQLPIVFVTVAPSRDGGDWLHKRTEIQHSMPTSPDFSELVPELLFRTAVPAFRRTARLEAARPNFRNRALQYPPESTHAH